MRSLGIVASGHKAASGGGFVPTDIAGMIGWWDAADGGSAFTYSTGNDPGDPGNRYVSQMTDLSGVGNHATGNANAGYHPKRGVSTIGGLAALDHSTGYIAQFKSLDVLGIGGAETKPCTGFAVVRFPATPLSNSYIFGSAGSTLAIRHSTAGTLQLIVPGVANIGNTSAGAITGGTDHLVDWSYSSGGAWTIGVDGTTVASGTNNQTLSTGTLALGAGNNAGGSSFGGVMGESGLYDSVVTGTDLSDLRSHLISKWGI